jgi:hypothetical protein
LALTLLASACQPAAKEPLLCAPAAADPDLVRIARTAELRHAQRLAGEASRLGITSPLVAVYEYSTFPYQPVVYFVAGEGKISRERLLEVALETFDGVRRPGSSNQELAEGEGSLLCTDFDRGKGMAAMSVACAWSDGGQAGYAVRLRGVSLPRDAKPIAALSATVSQRRHANSGACPDMQEIAEQLARPADRDQMVRDAVAAIHGFDIERLSGFFPDGARELFQARLEPAMLNGVHGDPLERVAHVLGTLEYPRSELLEIEIANETADRAVLRLKSSPVHAKRLLPSISLLGRILEDAERAAAEAAYREAEMVLVRDGDGWRMDTEWAIAQVQDWYLKLYVLWPASPPGWESPLPYGDREAILERMRAHLEREPRRGGAASIVGVAPVDALPHVVFTDVAQDARAVCMSARSASGERFMKRVDHGGQTTFARGSEVPNQCPTQPLGIRW